MMKSVSGLVLAGIFWVTAAPAVLPAHAGDALTLEEAVTTALRANPGLQQQRHDRDSQRIETSIASRQRLPQVELRAGRKRYAHPTLIHPIEEEGVFPTLDTSASSVGLYMRLPLYLGGRLVAGESLAGHRHESSLVQLQAGRQDLIFNVVATYAKAWQMRELANAQSRRILFLTAELDAIEQKIALGRVAPRERLRVEAQLSRARLQHADALQGAGDARALLAVLMDRDPPEEVLAPLPRLAIAPPATAEAAAAAARDRHPRVRRARAELAAAEDLVDIARGDRRPRVDLVANARTSRDGDWDGRDDWEIGLELSLPLFDGGIRSRRTDQARLEQSRASRELAGALAEVAAEARKAYAALHTAEMNIGVARAGLADAKEVLRIEKLMYREGRGTVTDLLSADSANARATADLKRTEYDLLVARARLLRSQGVLTPEKLGVAGPSESAEAHPVDLGDIVRTQEGD